ncbi:tetratricopeptide repeat protein [Maricaulis sp.]|uniref:tetratricopeptide repeat protein n=1 Tax=Maricaulis sp. TaxID=1486257 RepID=UPI003A8CF078
MTDAALTDEFQAEAEAAKNDAVGARGARGRLSTDVRLGVVPKDQRAKYRKAANLVVRGIKLSDEGDHQEGAKYILRALDIAPEVALTNHAVGLVLFRVGRLSKALEYYERAWKLDPKDAEIYLNMGIVAWKLDMLEAAEKFYRLCVQIDPKNLNGVINLASVLRDQARIEDAIELLRTAIFQHPENVELWNSLGTVLAESGDPAGAITFFEEALRLKPDFARAHNNMANMYELIGEPFKAVEHFELALRNPQDATDRATMEHGRSLLLLACGRVADGWKAQQSRLDLNNAQATVFAMNCPRWESHDLADLRGKTVVLVGEQGLGDEVLFLNTAQELIDAIGPEGELRIACEYRLVPLVQRSLPKAKVGNHTSAKLEGRDVRTANHLDDGADYWTPMGDPLNALRPTLNSFPKRPAFLTADPERVAAWRDYLGQIGGGLKVGILWKSLKMNVRRARFFSEFEDWKSIFAVDGVDFINLQYGEITRELKQAKELFNVDIHQPQGIDLKMDLDDVAALSSTCDLVIGPMNATSNLAAATGGLVWFIHARSTTWPLLGSDHMHWYPQTRSYFGKGFREFDTLMPRVAADLEQLVKERK